jgi:hypothetical protein
MMLRSLSVAFTLTALGALVGLAAADDPKPSPETPKTETPEKPAKPKLPDFSGYQFVRLLDAEVVKADDSKITVRIYWEHAVAKGNGGGRGRRPNLHGSRGFHSPFAIRRPNVQIKWEHHDYEIPYIAESLVRTKQLPPKVGPDGKRGFYSAKEQDELSQPIGAPGFQAAKSDIKAGTIVELHLIRDKFIAANNVKDEDMRIKYAVILREDPNPPKDIASNKSSPAKKN